MNIFEELLCLINSSISGLFFVNCHANKWTIDTNTDRPKRYDSGMGYEAKSLSLSLTHNALVNLYSHWFATGLFVVFTTKSIVYGGKVGL